MSGAEDEDQIDSAFYPGFKRRVKTETEERPESYQAMLQQMQDRMGKMEEKYETEMAEMAMENDAQARIIQKLQAKIGTTKSENGTTTKTTKDETTTKDGNEEDDEEGNLRDEDSENEENDEDDDDDDDEGYLKDDDDASLQWVEENPVYALDAWISPCFPPTALQGKVKDKWLVNIGSLTTHVRSCFQDEFDALSAALLTGNDVPGAVTTLVKQVSDHLGEAAFLTPVLLSRTVIAASSTSTFAAKAADVVNQTWRAYMKSEPKHITQLRAQIKANEVPERLTEPDPHAPTPMAYRLQPTTHKKYHQAYETVLVLLKEALNAAARISITPRELRQAWISSFPKACDDVQYIISQQRSAYEALVAALGEDLPDKERIATLRACFSPRLLQKHSDELADAGHDADTVKWLPCIKLAKKAAGYLRRRKTYDPTTTTTKTTTTNTTTTTTNTRNQQLKHLCSDPDWVNAHRSDLIAYGICSNYVIRGTCDKGDACSFLHELPETIDLGGPKWQAACERAAAYRSKKRAERERQATAAPATLALPAPPPTPRKEVSWAPEEEDVRPLEMPPPPARDVATVSAVTAALHGESPHQAETWLGKQMMGIHDDKYDEWGWSRVHAPGYEPDHATRAGYDWTGAPRALACPAIFDENGECLECDPYDDFPPTLRR